MRFSSRTSSNLEDRTSFALGLKKEEFTIANRQDNGVRTDYRVRTKQGATYSCYVTGAVGITGREVSDAICSRSNAVSETSNKKSPASGSSCNALLKAANTC
jgi:hypothetical protein